MTRRRRGFGRIAQTIRVKVKVGCIAVARPRAKLAAPLIRLFEFAGNADPSTVDANDLCPSCFVILRFRRFRPLNHERGCCGVERAER